MVSCYLMWYRCEGKLWRGGWLEKQKTWQVLMCKVGGKIGGRLWCEGEDGCRHAIMAAQAEAGLPVCVT